MIRVGTNSEAVRPPQKGQSAARTGCRMMVPMRSLKIGIVAPMVVKSATGLSNYIAELVPELCDAGHHVTVLATNCAYRGAPADEIVSIDGRCTLKLFPSTGRVSRRVYHSAELSAWLRQNVRLKSVPPNARAFHQMIG